MGCIKSKSAKDGDEQLTDKSTEEEKKPNIKLNTVMIDSAPRGSLTNAERDERSYTDVNYLDKKKSVATEGRDKRLEELKEKRRKEAEEDKRNAAWLFKLLGQ